MNDVEKFNLICSYVGHTCGLECLGSDLLFGEREEEMVERDNGVLFRGSPRTCALDNSEYMAAVEGCGHAIIDK
jgi:hypothetical protein